MSRKLSNCLALDRSVIHEPLIIVKNPDNLFYGSERDEGNSYLNLDDLDDDEVSSTPW